MAEQPRVSVIIPTHNHHDWVFAAIDSVLLQPYPIASLVVVDDGSSDTTALDVAAYLDLRQAADGQFSGIGKYLGRDVPVTLQVNSRPTGPALARNLGASLSKVFSPHLYAFLDSDDVYDPEKIVKSVQAWQKSPQSIGVVYSDYETLNPQGVVTRVYKEPYSQSRLMQECIINCDSLVSVEAFEWAGGFPPLRVCEDYGLWLKLSGRYLAYHIPEALVTIRVGDHSSSSTVPKMEWQECYRKAFELAGIATI